MSVVSARIINFKKLEDIDIKIDKKSFFVIGDTGEGKTSLLLAILSSVMLVDFPEEPLTTGKESGMVSIVHEFEGRLYTFKRTFTNNKKLKTRWTVTDDLGGRHTPTDLLERMLGKAFINHYFDYNEFFHKQKSRQARFIYLVKAAGGEQVFENYEKVNRLTKERGRIGTEKDRYETLINESSLNPETLEADLIFYAEEQTNEVAVARKAEILLKRKSIKNLSNQLAVARECNSEWKIAEEQLDIVSKEIIELEAQLKLAYQKKEVITSYMATNPPDEQLEKDLEAELDKAEEFNLEIEDEADEVYNSLVMDANIFNSRRKELFDILKTYEDLQGYIKEWDEKDAKIKRLVAESKKIFTKRLPIPGMTIEEVDGEPIIMYEGREFTYENISKGKSLRLTMEIQRFLNPKGNNFIVIPEAQSLGSELDDILQECKDHNIQALVEVTERKQKFQIKFEEDYL